MKLQSPLLGINNRTKTLKTDIQTTCELAPRVIDADRLVVSESGLCAGRSGIDVRCRRPVFSDRGVPDAP